MADAMTKLIKDRQAIIVAVPTATTRVRQRGYDQTKLLARHIAKQARMLWIDCLARSGQAHQVGSGKDERLAQLKSALRVTQERFIRGAHIILIDDVITTGATLETAAEVLKEAGAAHIEAIAFARAIPRNVTRLKRLPSS
jgi:ComF family protein